MMYPYLFYEAAAQERQRNLDRKLRHEHFRRERELAAASESVMLRLGGAEDADALVRLATL